MSALYVRKWAAYFDRFDYDGDGELTLKDFKEIADKLVEKGKLDAERGAKLKSQFVEAWDKFFKDLVDGERLSKSVFLEAAKQTYGNKDLLELTKSIFTLLFSSIDANEDGKIDEKEYIRFFDVLRINEHIAKMSFQAIDSDHDGKLSLDEYIGALMEHLTTDDENSKYILFWGPLGNY